MPGQIKTIDAQAAAEEMNRCAGMIRHTPDPVSLISLDHVYLMVNHAFCTAHGKTADQVVGKQVSELWGRGVFDGQIRGALSRCFAGETMHFSGAIPFGILGERYFSVTYYPYIDTEGDISGAVVSSRDITEFKRAADAQEESEQRYRALFQSSADALLVIDAEANIIEANEAARRIFGYTDDELCGLPFGRLFDPDHAHHVAPTTRDSPAWSGRTTESVAARSCGEAFPVDIRLSPVRYRDRAVFLATIRDITEAKKAQEEIAHLANFDMITGFPNRRHFSDLLEGAIARAKRNDSWLALLYIDLDRFKSVNDRFGHHVGDELLAEVAKRIDNTLREIDVAGRIGGDEFAVILESVPSIGDGVAVVRKLLAALSREFRVVQCDVDISASIGIAMYPQHCTDPVRLVRRADCAMYHAKREGSAFCLWSPELSRDESE